MLHSLDLPFWIALPVALLLLLGGVIAFTGSLGLLRLPTFYTRIHAPTMGNTMGVFCVLVGSLLLVSWQEHRLLLHHLLITLLLVITSPVTAVLLMRAAIRRKVGREQAQAGTHPPQP
ncbi:MAG: monovalent cation/H(+) antiporter subunit G [Castellaniella sp.]